MIHHVFANRSNIGDWLSAKGIQRLLAPAPIVEHLCDEPFVEDTLAALAAIQPRDLVVIGGGGLFMDYFAPFWIGFDRLAPQIDYCIWGAGCCDLKAEFSHPPLDVVRGVVMRARLCAVRDALTQAYLAPAAVPEPVACSALAAVEPQPPGWGVLHVANYTTVGAAAYEAMDEACQGYAEFTGRPYRQTNNRIEPDREHEMAQLVSLYARSDLIVSSALHGCILAVAMGRPVLAVSGDRKIEAFMQMAGLGHWVLDAAQVDRLAARLDELPGQAAVRAFVARARAQNAAIAAEVKRIASTLGSDRVRSAL